MNSLILILAILSLPVSAWAQMQWTAIGDVDFTGAHRFDDGRTVISTTGGYLLWGDDAAATFSQQLVVGLPAMTCMCFANDRVGYIGTYDGEILRTSSGGEDWSRSQTPTDHALSGIVALPFGRLFVLDSKGVLYRSSDAGEHWEVLTSPDSLSPPLVGWASDRIVACGDGGALWCYSDSLAEWRRIRTPLISRPTAFAPWGEDLLYAACGSTIAVSRDAGLTWNSSGSTVQGPINLIEPVSSDLVLLHEGGPSRAYSSDAGSTWQSTRVDSNIFDRFDGYVRTPGWRGHDGWIYSIGLFGTIYSVAPDGIEDRPVHQYNVGLPPLVKSYVTSVPANISLLRAVQENGGSFMYSSDGGLTWLSRFGPDRNRSIGIYAPDSLRCIVHVPSAPSANYLAPGVTTDNGRSWETIHNTPRDSLFGPLVIHQGILEMCSLRRIFRSFDGGFTWPDTMLYEAEFDSMIDSRRSRISDNVFFGSDTVYLRVRTYPGLRTDSWFVRSTDAGHSWTRGVLLVEGDQLRSMAFATSTIGVVVGLPGSHLRTTDAGASWQPCAIPSGANELRSVAFNSTGSVGLAVGAGGSIFVSSDSGSTWSPDSAHYYYRHTSRFDRAFFLDDTTALIESGYAIFRKTFPATTRATVEDSRKFNSYFFVYEYPNPALGHSITAALYGLHAVSDRSSLQYEIYDIWGRKELGPIRIESAPDVMLQKEQIDISNLTSGLYVLKLTSSDGVKSAPFVVLH